MQIKQTTREYYDQYCAKMRKIADLKNTMAVLGWDQETYLPENSAHFRGEQLATLSGISHELFADAALGVLLERLSAADDLDDAARKNVMRTLEDYNKNKKYSTDFVTRMSHATSACYHAWIRARKENDYKWFQPELEKMVRFKQEEAALLGYHHHPYDALLDDYEKGATTSMLDGIFENVKKELSAFLKEIQAKPLLSNDFLHGHYDRDSQWEFGLEILEKMGFDFKSGRQDVSEHPFTTSFSPQDVRITTRVDEQDLGNMTWSCIHEGGHGLYEQGLNVEQYGLPCGEAASLSVHESQSRLWENCVGRSRAFWEYYFPLLQKRFPANLAAVDPETFYKGINRVQPSLIRTEADEITYHFHVMIRYEIEKQLIAGDLSVQDLPAAWNEWYYKYLGVKVPDDKQGVLQDIHWSHGSFGYFPTYSLGSFYAAQFFAVAEKEIPGLTPDIANGNTGKLLTWLRERIHRHGRFYTSEELCRKVTGEGLNFQYFMRYAREKFDGIYGNS